MLKPDEPGFIQGFDWGLYPECEKFLFDNVEKFLSKNSMAKTLAGRMANEASTRFFDWIDFLSLPQTAVSEKQLAKLGYEEAQNNGLEEGSRLFRHTKTEFFPIIIAKGKQTEIALKPEEIDSFLETTGSGIEAQGTPLSAFRKAILSKENNCVLSAVERRGSSGYAVGESNDADEIEHYKEALSSFSSRKRLFSTDKEGMRETEKLVSSYLGKISAGRVADAFLRPERDYWQKRNKAGQVQKRRQDKLGLGWGNHDHHTYRSSRENFAGLIKIFEKMGYLCREKFYAGEEAGWGAQILEHPLCDIVLFADVDLFKEETSADFPHKGLENRKNLGTVGLWIGLHGESILQAGMHHLEARFDFEKLRNDLPQFGVSVMKPFSYFDFLKQAFTTGEIWQVDKQRAKNLLKAGSINQGQYEKFTANGAIGSHLENLQRNKGFKGFNQHSVSAILKATDPRVYKDNKNNKNNKDNKDNKDKERHA